MKTGSTSARATELAEQTGAGSARRREARIALTHRDGEFGAISGVCNHVGGPLGQGRLDGDFVVCPWHYYKFHWQTGEGEPGYEADRVPSHARQGRERPRARLGGAVTKRGRLPHDPHPLAREPRREPGPIRVLGISTTSMTEASPRYSTSEDLLLHALANARERGEGDCDTR